MRGPFLTAFLLVAGCALGGQEEQDGVTVRKDAGDTGGPSSDTGSGSTDTGTTFDSGSLDTGSADTGSPDTTVTDTGVTDTGTGEPCTVLGPSDCKSSATILSSISGDTGKGVATRTGSNSAWFRVMITEDDSSVFSTVKLNVRITLDSPPGGNFDLYVYKGKAKGAGGAIECSAVASSSTSTLASDVVALDWSDTHPIGGYDDSTPISIEVRPVGTSCPTTDTWTLTVEGHK